jgi:hypothetical protein
MMHKTVDSNLYLMGQLPDKADYPFYMMSLCQNTHANWYSLLSGLSVNYKINVNIKARK